MRPWIPKGYEAWWQKRHKGTGQGAHPEPSLGSLKALLLCSRNRSGDRGTRAAFFARLILALHAAFSRG